MYSFPILFSQLLGICIDNNNPYLSQGPLRKSNEITLTQKNHIINYKVLYKYVYQRINKSKVNFSPSFTQNITYSENKSELIIYQNDCFPPVKFTGKIFFNSSNQHRDKKLHWYPHCDF